MEPLDHFRRLERMYASAPINGIYRPTLKVADGATVLTMLVRPDFFHAAGALHGSVYFKMLDDAAFFAAASRVSDVFVLTASFHLHLLRPVAAGTLHATGQVVQDGRQFIVAESELRDDDGRVLARGSGNFARGRTPLTSCAGYASSPAPAA